MDTLLQIKNVKHLYHTPTGETLAVKGLNFTVNKGEFISIIGPSGCGKTTVLSLIAGLLTATDGEILLENQPVKAGSNDLGYMLQKDHLFSWRTIEKNVTLPLEIKKLNSKENKDYGIGLLKKYGLGDFLKSYPNELSGGMRQRVALIRTLVSRPKLLLLDEPFSALDYQTRLNVAEDVHTIIKGENQTAILVTHDISEAISLSDRILVLTKRPCSVKNEHVVSLRANTPLKRRELSDFSKWFEILYKEVKTNEK